MWFEVSWATHAGQTIAGSTSSQWHCWSGATLSPEGVIPLPSLMCASLHSFRADMIFDWGAKNRSIITPYSELQERWVGMYFTAWYGPKRVGSMGKTVSRLYKVGAQAREGLKSVNSWRQEKHPQSSCVLVGLKTRRKTATKNKNKNKRKNVYS